MKGPSELPEREDDLRKRIIGLGERSFRKSYYPELQHKLADLQRFKALLDESNDAIFLLRVPSGQFAEVNLSACKQLGYTLNECMVLSIYDIMGSGSEGIEMLLSGKKESLMLEAYLRSKDKTMIPYEINAHTVRFGSEVYVVCVARDITERKKAEAALRSSEAKFRVLTDTSPAAIFLHEGGRILYANKAMSALTGYSGEELLRMQFWEWIDPRDAGFVKERGLARLRGDRVPSRFETRYVANDGKCGWVDFSAGLISIEGVRMLLVTAFDVTERKLADLAMKKSKAQAELYVDLMGHDITNMNQIGLGYLELARDVLDMKGHIGAGERDFIEKPIEVFKKSSKLISNVKKLQKESEGGLKAEIIDVGKMLGNIKAQYSGAGGRDIIINYRPVSACYVLANELLYDVFSQIVENAIEHSTGALVIDIILDRAFEDRRECAIIAIEDNGPGISDDMKRTIMDRASLAGMRMTGKGFGLCLVKMLLDDFHGWFRIEDRVPGDHRKGSRFVVLLPMAGH